MYVRIVTFRLDGQSHDDYRAQAEAAGPAFLEWPGLSAKIWLSDPETATYGGVYLFDSAEDAATSRGTILFQTMAANPAFAELSVREFAVLDAPTAITGPAVVR
jgi:hypothetical protein